MAFIQLVEITTSCLEGIEAIKPEGLAATEGKRSAHRSS